jgi:hypothetical protein
MPGTTTAEATSTEDWRRNPWVWLVIAIPSLTVLGCALTVYLAITHPDAIVHDSAAPTSSAPGNTDSVAE